jgi:hypothetical protein
LRFFGIIAKRIAMSTIDQIIAAVRELPSEDRGRLVPLLWDQIAPEDWAAPSSLLIAESNRRRDSIDAGELETDDLANVRARARRKDGLSEGLGFAPVTPPKLSSPMRCVGTPHVALMLL